MIIKSDMKTYKNCFSLIMNEAIENKLEIKPRFPNDLENHFVGFVMKVMNQS